MAENSDLYKKVNNVLGHKDYIVGGTDGIAIGNTSDRLKVDAQITSTSSGVSPTISQKYRFDINTTQVSTSSGSYTTLYNYSGSGLFYGYQLACDNTHVQMRLTIDGTVLFDFDGNMLGTFNALLGNNQSSQEGGFFNLDGNSFDFSPRYPIPYSSSIKIEVKSSDNSSHHINGYFVNITKET